MIRLAFDVPVPHFGDFKDLQDFHVAHAAVAMADVKYREKAKPIGLLLADPMPIDELRRVVALCTPHHVTVHPPADERQARELLDNCNVAFDTELAMVIPPGSDTLYDMAIGEDVSVVYLPWHDYRLLWLLELTGKKGLAWIHFEEVSSAAELKDMVDLKLPSVSLHTAKPVKMAFYDCDWLGAQQLPDLDPHQSLTKEQVAKARELMQAMREVCV